MAFVTRAFGQPFKIASVDIHDKNLVAAGTVGLKYQLFASHNGCP